MERTVSLKDFRDTRMYSQAIIAAALKDPETKEAIEIFLKTPKLERDMLYIMRYGDIAYKHGFAEIDYFSDKPSFSQISVKRLFDILMGLSHTEDLSSEFERSLGRLAEAGRVSVDEAKYWVELLPKGNEDIRIINAIEHTLFKTIPEHAENADISNRKEQIPLYMAIASATDLMFKLDPAERYHSSDEETVFTIVGRPGSGKTYALLSTLREKNISVTYHSFKYGKENITKIGPRYPDKSNGDVEVFDDINYLYTEVMEGRLPAKAAVDYIRQITAQIDRLGNKKQPTGKAGFNTFVISEKPLEEYTSLGPEFMSEAQKLTSPKRLIRVDAIEWEHYMEIAEHYKKNNNAHIDKSALYLLYEANSNLRILARVLNVMGGVLTLDKLKDLCNIPRPEEPETSKVRLHGYGDSINEILYLLLNFKSVSPYWYEGYATQDFKDMAGYDVSKPRKESAETYTPLSLRLKALYDENAVDEVIVRDTNAAELDMLTTLLIATIQMVNKVRGGGGTVRKQDKFYMERVLPSVRRGINRLVFDSINARA
ncbi:MAG: hypothetical protein KGH60_01435 [Candidatus Micrarchaeota archaeon]|nr:hypothetical protein [Candidatus Micrarchaeota archaeon]